MPHVTLRTPWIWRRVVDDSGIQESLVSSLSSMSDVSFGIPAERTVKARMREARRERIDERDIWGSEKGMCGWLNEAAYGFC